MCPHVGIGVWYKAAGLLMAAFQAQACDCFIPLMLPRMTAAPPALSCLGRWAEGLAEEYHTPGPPGPPALNSYSS